MGDYAKWAKDHPDEHAAYVRDWRRRHPERVKELRRENYVQNPGRHIAYVTKYAGSHRDKLALDNRRFKLGKCYGVTDTQYLEWVERQGGVCAICVNYPPEGKRLLIDHDHKCCPGVITCGKCMRDLLCYKCNYIVGAYESFIRGGLKAPDFGVVTLYVGKWDSIFNRRGLLL
jgi:Recombination endonuclease VII